MLRKVTGFVIMLCAFLLISVGLLPRIPVAHATDFKVVADSSGICIVSGEPIFDIENTAPGDRKNAALEVVNNSSESFILAISADFEGDDSCKLFYEGLQIDIGTAYSGPLSGLKAKKLGSFAPGSMELVPMEISLPTTAGNECQGQTITVRFRIYQLSDAPPQDPGDLDPIDPSDPEEPKDIQPGPTEPDPKDPEEREPSLPVTGTNVHWLLPLGLVMFLVGLLLLGTHRKEQ